MTKEEAIDICNTTIRASVTFETCEGLLGLEVTAAIDTCVMDIQWSRLVHG